MVWTNVAGSKEPGNYTGGTGDAASASSDKFGPAPYDTELRTPKFGLAGAVTASVTYLANFRNLSGPDFLNLDISIDGGILWATPLWQAMQVRPSLAAS